MLIRYGCTDISTKGSHFKVENSESGKRAAVPIHAGKDIDTAFIKKILRELGIDLDDFDSMF